MVICLTYSSLVRAIISVLLELNILLVVTVFILYQRNANLEVEVDEWKRAPLTKIRDAMQRQIADYVERRFVVEIALYSVSLLANASLGPIGLDRSKLRLYSNWPKH